MKTEITLPIELYKLGLEEIGAIFVLMCSPYMDDGFKQYWMKDERFRQLYVDLKEDGIIISKGDGEFEIDLTWV